VGAGYLDHRLKLVADREPAEAGSFLGVAHPVGFLWHCFQASSATFALETHPATRAIAPRQVREFAMNGLCDPIDVTRAHGPGHGSGCLARAEPRKLAAQTAKSHNRLTLFRSMLTRRARVARACWPI